MALLCLNHISAAQSCQLWNRLQWSGWLLLTKQIWTKFVVLTFLQHYIQPLSSKTKAVLCMSQCMCCIFGDKQTYSITIVTILHFKHSKYYTICFCMKCDSSITLQQLSITTTSWVYPCSFLVFWTKQPETSERFCPHIRGVPTERSSLPSIIHVDFT